MFKPYEDTKFINCPNYTLTIVNDYCESYTVSVQPFNMDSLLRYGDIVVSHAIGLAVDIVNDCLSDFNETSSVIIAANFVEKVDSKMCALSLMRELVRFFGARQVKVSNVEVIGGYN